MLAQTNRRKTASTAILIPSFKPLNGLTSSKRYISGSQTRQDRIDEILTKLEYEKTTRLSNQGPIECSLTGFALLNSPLYNKGSAFTYRERMNFGLVGLLPAGVNTLDQQIQRAFQQFSSLESDLAKNDFLTSMRVQNKVLFFELVRRYIKDMFHIIYTPTEGEAIMNYSTHFRKPEGCFLDITAPDQADIEAALEPFGDDEDVDYIVVSDGEGILGIGDQGTAGIRIASAKLALMTVCGGIHPGRGIPIALDAGTNNKALLQSELYLGNKVQRVRGVLYDRFIYNFIQVIKRKYPSAVLHFEDFGVLNARKILNTYKNELACFNDDIQGTGAVVMSSITAALKVIDAQLEDVKVVIFGAGSAGLGIAFQIVDNLVANGMSVEDARKKIWLVDRQGVLLKSDEDLISSDQALFACDDAEWEGVDRSSLLEVVKHVQPHVLIGCSTKPKAFTEEIVKEMYQHVPRPIIFPLSNPTELHEAVPEDLLKWTNGDALIATGSPFAPVNGKVISENNNCFTFPGIGLGVVLSRATLITNKMIAAAVAELANLSPILKDPKGGLLPDISDIREVSARVATAVVLAAVKEGVTKVQKEIVPGTREHVKVPVDFDECLTWVKTQMWNPTYRPMLKVNNRREPTHQY